MIFGNINDKAQYDLLCKDENFKIALNYIKANNFKDEKVNIKDNDIYAFKNVINTKPFENYFEIHHKYADIFYIIDGQEDIYLTDAKQLKALEKYDEKSDVVHGTVETYQKISLKKGDYIVIFPEDAHCPSRGDGKPLEKLIIKVKVA